MFGAGLDAQSAGTALFGVDEQRLLPAMRCPFEFADESQTSSQVGWKRIHFEDGIRAGGDAIRFAFAFVAVNHGDEDARVLAAGGCVCHQAFSISFAILLSLIYARISGMVKTNKKTKKMKYCPLVSGVMNISCNSRKLCMRKANE